MSSSFGERVRFQIFGQSHGEAIGVVIDGLPAGEAVDIDALRAFLGRRAPGNAAYATKRKEADEPEFLSGLIDGYTCGAPVCAVIRNTNARSNDYSDVKAVPRPGHADFAAMLRDGEHADLRGGGHFSGRLTAPLCVAGGVAKQILARRGVTIGAHIAAIAGIADMPYDPVAVTKQELLYASAAEFPVLDPEAGARMREAILEAAKEGDSVGGIVECCAIGLEPGKLGRGMFGGIESRLAPVLFGIPAVKGVEFGLGFAAAALKGSENNDPFGVAGRRVLPLSNNHGGVLGGISSGMPLLFRVTFKPTPSIAKPQQSVNMQTLEPETLIIHGRHDPCIVPRAVPVAEAAAACVLLDMML
ncbi:MAG TPA: chorismate synthase [Feifaniaceae bacterium]|nr:chorismate synthase [Feifaniaceae bacterium]